MDTATSTLMINSESGIALIFFAISFALVLHFFISIFWRIKDYKIEDELK